MKSINICPSERVNSVSEYYFSKKLAEVAKLKSEGKKIISLAIGGPDCPPAQEVIDELCVQSCNPNNHSYQNTRAIPELRYAFAKWYEQYYGVTLDDESELLPLIGSKEGIIHVSLAFLNHKDKVLVPNPGYPTYTSATKIAGGIPIPYNIKSENGWQPDFDELEELVDKNNDIKLMWVNYPHMPTGASARQDVMQKLVNFGEEHSIVIVNDNPYSFILNDNPTSILEIPGAKNICIEMNSLSKSHNMAGWRVAMLASNREFIQWILRIKSNVDSGQFRPVMLAAVKALSMGKDWYDSLNQTYYSRRKWAEKIMNELNCDFDKSQRGLFLWGKIPDSMPSGEWLSDKLLYEADVFITPGFIFGSNGDRYVRISLCSPETDFVEACKRINLFMKQF